MQFNLIFSFPKFSIFPEVNISLFNLFNIVRLFFFSTNQTLDHCLNILSRCSEKSASLQFYISKVSPKLMSSSLNCLPPKPTPGLHPSLPSRNLSYFSPLLDLCFSICYFSLFSSSLAFSDPPIAFGDVNFLRT